MGHFCFTKTYQKNTTDELIVEGSRHLVFKGNISKALLSQLQTSAYPRTYHVAENTGLFAPFKA